LSVRNFKNFVAKEFGKKRKETIVLGEHVLVQFDRLRKKYGDLSTLELIQVMLERELKAPTSPQKNNAINRGHLGRKHRSRNLPVAVKRKVYDGEWYKCGVRYGLEYDHIQMLCRSCNQRKEIIAGQSGFFV
ncbi:MAG: hypothetical protein OXB88_07850, partial [Bacteriovoracales bacterium]|nr:hypothetical protein [Bacteriovoracales bacterium]